MYHKMNLLEPGAPIVSGSSFYSGMPAGPLTPYINYTEQETTTSQAYDTHQCPVSEAILYSVSAPQIHTWPSLQGQQDVATNVVAQSATRRPHAPHTRGSDVTTHVTTTSHQPHPGRPHFPSGTVSNVTSIETSLTYTEPQVPYAATVEGTPRTTEATPPGSGTVLSSSSSRSLLPPCLICGRRASGLHYGVNTCEACKGFFRRGLNRSRPYQCLQNESCQPGPNTLRMCSHCRYQRCVESGMSVQGIRMGRYTYERRRNYTLEVQYLHRLQESGRRSGIPQLLRNLSETMKEVESTMSNQEALQYHLVNIRSWTSEYTDYEIRRQMVSQILSDMDCRLLLDGLSTLRSIIGNAVVSQDLYMLFKEAVYEVWVLLHWPLFDHSRGLLTLSSGLTFPLVWLLGPEATAEFARSTARLANLQLSQMETVLLTLVAVFSADRAGVLQQPECVEQHQARYLEALTYVLTTRPLRFPGLLAKCMQLLTDLRDFSVHAPRALETYWSSELLQFPFARDILANRAQNG